MLSWKEGEIQSDQDWSMHTEKQFQSRFMLTFAPRKHASKSCILPQIRRGGAMCPCEGIDLPKSNYT